MEKRRFGPGDIIKYRDELLLEIVSTHEYKWLRNINHHVILNKVIDQGCDFGGGWPGWELADEYVVDKVLNKYK